MKTYKSDPLLKARKLYINGELNLYAALVKTCDFEVKSKLKSLAFCYSPDFKEFLDSLPEIYRKDNFFFLRNLHAIYADDSKFSSLSCFRRWYENGTFPVSLVRTVSLCFNDSKILQRFLNSIITDSHHINSVHFPLKKSDILNNNDLFYLCGCITGDGYISEDRLIKIVDGHPKESELESSKVFIEKISRIVYDIFGYKPMPAKKKYHLYEMHIISKWIVRFLHFFFDIPYSPKKNIIWPKIVDGHEKYYLRGLFDTDGGIHKDSKLIVFKSASENFASNVRDKILDFGMTPSDLRIDNIGSYYFSIYAHDIEKFAKAVGFSHPRKKEYLVKHLKRGASDTAFIGINESNVYNGYFDLALMKELRVLGLGGVIRNIRTEKKMTQEYLARKLGIERKNLTRYENGVLAIPIHILSRIFNSKYEMYKAFSRENVKVGTGGHMFIRFPIDIKKINLEAYRFLSPVTDYVIIRKRQKGYILDTDDIHKIRTLLDDYFDVKSNIRNGKSNDILIQSKTLSLLLNRFFIYSKPWGPIKNISDSDYS